MALNPWIGGLRRHRSSLESHVKLHNRNAIQIPLNRAAIKCVDIRRWADHYLLPLDFVHARQAGNLLIGMESSCRDCRQNPARRQRNVEDVWSPIPSDSYATTCPA